VASKYRTKKSVDAIDFEIFSFPPQWGVQFFVTCLYYSVILCGGTKAMQIFKTFSSEMYSKSIEIIAP